MISKGFLPEGQFSGLLDVIAPQALDFKQKEIIFGEQLARVMVIRNYPTQVDDAWLSRVAKIPGVVCSSHVLPADTMEFLDQIKKSYGEFKGKLDSGGRNIVESDLLNDQIKGTKLLLRKITQEQQKVFWFITVLFIFANDIDELEKRTRKVQSILAGAGMRGRVLMFLQKQGLLAAGPWAIIPDEIRDQGENNMPSETVAASFPFSAAGMNDGSGVVFGKDADEGLILLDIWLRGGDRANANMIIIAKPGTGKSYAFKTLATRELARGRKVIVIDPEREYKEWCHNLGGVWVNCAGGQGRINPLQIRVALEEDEEKQKARLALAKANDNKNINNDAIGPLSLHLQLLRTFFTLYLQGVSEIDLVNLEDALLEVYNDAGIFWDTDPTTIKEEDWPTMVPLYKKIKQKAEEDPETWKKLAMLIKRAAEGADAPLWGGPTTAKADSDLVVLDIYDLLKANKSVKAAQYFNIFTWSWDKVAEDRLEKIILGCDEMGLLVDPKALEALETLRDFSKRFRKYEGSLIPITQNAIDFLGEEVKLYGAPIINNPTYKLLLGQGEEDLQVLSKLLRLTETEVDFLANAKRGHGLLIAGNQRIKVKIEASDYEKSLFGKGGGR